LVEAMFSDENEQGLVPASPELVARVTDEFDLLIGAGSGDLSRGYRIVLWLIEWLPLFVMGVFSRASRLPLERRLAYLQRLEQSKMARLATLLVAFKLPFTILAFEQGPELRLTGFDRESLSSRRLLRDRPAGGPQASPSNTIAGGPQASPSNTIAGGPQASPSNTKAKASA